MVKHWFAILSLCLLASVGFSSAGAQQSSVRVLAVVNDDIITDFWYQNFWGEVANHFYIKHNMNIYCVHMFHEYI